MWRNTKSSFKNKKNYIKNKLRDWTVISNFKNLKFRNMKNNLKNFTLLNKSWMKIAIN